MRVLFLLSLLVFNGLAKADVLVSSDWCSIEWESLTKISSGLKSEVLWSEANEILKYGKSKGIDCLSGKRIGKMHGSIAKKVKKDRCELLPKTFYTDGKGKNIYKYSNLKWKRTEREIVNGKQGADCMEKYLLDQ